MPIQLVNGPRIVSVSYVPEGRYESIEENPRPVTMLCVVITDIPASVTAVLGGVEVPEGDGIRLELGPYRLIAPPEGSAN